jgi:hypothetical protein
MDGAIRKIQFWWAILALMTLSPMIILSPAWTLNSFGMNPTIVYLFFVTAAWVPGLLLGLLQFSSSVEPLGAMGRVVVLMSTATSTAILLIHAYRNTVISGDEVPASIIVGVIFGSLLGLALCYVARTFRRVPKNTLRT